MSGYVSLTAYTATAATVAVAGTPPLTTFTRTGAGPALLSPAGLNYPGAQTYLVKMRAKKTAGSGAPGTNWVGRLSYGIVGGHGFSASFKSEIAAPAGPALGEWLYLEWDASALTVGGSDWFNAAAIDQVKFELDDDTGSVWVIETVVFGSAGLSPRVGDLGRIDSLIATKAKTTDVGNRVLDLLLADQKYWALSTGWAFDVASAEVTGAGANQLNLPAAIKSVVGNGTTVQAQTAATVATTSSGAYYADVEPGEAIRVSGRILVKNGATIWPRLGCDWNDIRGASLSSSTILSKAGVDFRTVAKAGGDAIYDLETVIRVPTTAYRAKFFWLADWSTTLANAGYAQFALPRIRDGLSLAQRASAADAGLTQTLSNSNADNYGFEPARLVASVAIIATEKLVEVRNLIWLKCLSGSQACKVKISVVGPTNTYFKEVTLTLSSTILVWNDFPVFVNPDWGPTTVKVEITPTGALTSPIQYSKFVLIAEDDRTRKG